MGLTAVAFRETRRLGQETVAATFMALAEVRAGAHEHSLAGRLEVVESIGLLYDVSTRVSRDEFSRLVQPYCTRHRGVRHLGWIPVVPGIERSDYELGARRDGMERFQIIEPDSAGHFVRAGERDRYLPVYYVEPYAGGAELLGLDMAIDEVVASLLAQARDSGHPVADVVIEPEDGREPAARLRIFLPVYDGLGVTFTVEGRRENLKGFVFGIFDLGPTVEAELAILGPAGVDIELWGGTGQERQLLHVHASGVRSSPENLEHRGREHAARLASEHPFHVVGLDWTVRCVAAPAFLKQHARHNHWWVLSGGLIITTASSFYLRMHLTRTAWVQRLVTERTQELRTANEELAKEVTERQEAEAQLRTAQKRLVATAHRAGMADVASEVLHNVGNILNSINIGTTQMSEMVAASKVDALARVIEMLDERREDLGTFLSKDAKGKHIPVFLSEVSVLLQNERDRLAETLDGLSKNVQHIKDTITTQQAYARVSAVEQPTSLEEVIEDALQIEQAGLEQHGVRLVRELETLPPVQINKQKVVQILVNLIKNGKYAAAHSEAVDKVLHIRLYRHGETTLRIEVIDNGMGIAREDLTKIFRHGFTTKTNGHGFGLHSGALAAKEMGGSLRAESSGPGHGATFTLEFPYKPMVRS
jgi:signal transduction histidine kinase